MQPCTNILIDPTQDVEQMGFFKKKGYIEKLKEVKEMLLQTYSKLTILLTHLKLI